MSITLNTKVYNGRGFNSNGFFSWAEVSSGIASAFSWLTNKVAVGTGKSRSSVRWNMAVPIASTDDTPCGCEGNILRTANVNIEVKFDSTATAAERQDVRKRIQSLVLDQQFIDSVDLLAQASTP